VESVPNREPSIGRALHSRVAEPSWTQHGIDAIGKDLRHTGTELSQTPAFLLLALVSALLLFALPAAIFQECARFLLSPP